MLRATIFGKLTTAAVTPGTMTLTCNWGGTGGTNLSTSGALTLVAGGTNVSFRLEYVIQCTAASTLSCEGLFLTTVAAYATPAFIPLPAAGANNTAVGSLTFTSAQALDFAVTFSAATNSLTANSYTLEDMS